MKKIKQTGAAINKFVHKPSGKWNLIDVGIITVAVTGVVVVGTLAIGGICGFVDGVRNGSKSDCNEFEI